MNENINIHLEKINVWLKLNKLTVNVSKTKFMIFHKRRVAPQLELLLNNIKIEPVSNPGYYFRHITIMEISH